MVFGGTRSPDDLHIHATLVGERLVEAPTWDERHHRHSTGTRMEPVLSRSQIASMPEQHALVIKNKMAPMLGRVQMAWKRPDVKATQRAARWHTQLAAVDELRGKWADSRARHEVAARQSRARDRGL
jgi:hypothetical protein